MKNNSVVFNIHTQKRNTECDILLFWQKYIYEWGSRATFTPVLFNGLSLLVLLPRAYLTAMPRFVPWTRYTLLWTPPHNGHMIG